MDNKLRLKGGRPKKPIKDVRRIFEAHGYKLLSNEFKDANQPIRYECQNHKDKELKASWNNISRGFGCPYCARERVKHSYDKIKLEFEQRGYTLVSKTYVKAGELLEYTCSLHPNTIQKITYNNLQRGHGCAYCAGNVKFTYDDVRRLFESKNYTLISLEYKNSKTKLEYICNAHPEHTQKITVDALNAGKGCQDCWGGRNSKLSKAIESVLINRNVIFYKEHRFNDCRLELPLAFDFYLPDFNMCIEVDGQQHFKPVTFRNMSREQAQKEYEKTIARDAAKDDYCKKKDIRLLRIPYYEAEQASEIIFKALG